MDEDEEVIFEGDPLYKHLQDTGNLEFEYVPKSVLATENYDKSKNIGTNNTYLKLWIEKSLTIFRNLLYPQELEIDNITLSRLKLLQNGVLPEDFMILESFSSLDDSHLWQNAQENKKLIADLIRKYQISWSRFIKQRLFELGYIFVILLPLWYLPNEYISLWVGLLFIFVAVIGLRLFLGWKLNNYRNKIDSFVSLSHNLFRVCSKSQKILNEIDFITKDVKLDFLTSTHSALYAAQVDAILEFINFLTKGHVTLQDIDSDFNSVAILFEARFSGVDTGFSDAPLTRLKVKRDVLSQQYSGFVTECILLMTVSKNLWNISKIFDYCQLSKVKNKMDVLEKCIRLANQTWFGNSEKILIDLGKKNKKLKNAVRVANSLSSHGKAFLSTFYRFEDLINSLYDSDVCSSEEFIAEGDLYCDQMGAELQSCSGCIDEIRTIFNPKDDRIDELKNSIVKPERVEATQNPTIRNEDAIIVDEVFEAFVTSSKAINDGHNWIDYNEEIESVVRQKSHCRSVLKEMQPILRERRIMWEKREDIALKRTTGEPLTAKRKPANISDDGNTDRVDAEGLNVCSSTESRNSQESTELTTECGKDPIELTIECKEDPIELTNCREDPIKLKTKCREDPIELTRECREDPIELTIECRKYPTELTTKCKEDPIKLTRELREDPIELKRERGEDTYFGDGISDGYFVPRGPQSLNERIASWNGNVGLGLMSVLTGSSHLCPPCHEEVFNAFGEQDSLSEEGERDESASEGEGEHFNGACQH